MKVKSESEVAQSCPTLTDPMDCSPPGSSIHRIFQARVLEWGAIAFSRGLCIETFFLNKGGGASGVQWVVVSDAVKCPSYSSDPATVNDLDPS